MGGKDVIYLKQLHSSVLQPSDVKKKLREIADKRFLDEDVQNGVDFEESHARDKVSLSLSLQSQVWRNFVFCIYHHLKCENPWLGL